MLRGGSWNNDSDNCRSANRNHNDPDNRNNNIGFRLCRAVAVSPNRPLPEGNFHHARCRVCTDLCGRHARPVPRGRQVCFLCTCPIRRQEASSTGGRRDQRHGGGWGLVVPTNVPARHFLISRIRDRMAKSYRNLWPQIVSWENLLLAYRRCRRRKRFKSVAVEFEFAWEHLLLEIQRELIDGSYQPGPYRHFFIRDPKPRKISCRSFSRSCCPSCDRQRAGATL